MEFGAHSLLQTEVQVIEGADAFLVVTDLSEEVWIARILQLQLQQHSTSTESRFIFLASAIIICREESALLTEQTEDLINETEQAWCRRLELSRIAWKVVE
ncbi:unnamed protein product [Schistocephalus solidus]|uniref:Uncharacterized protein n=1 Tax=Schistocephalus solidus TaxID=70667 RepID=A0A183TSQ8_SCHSO|nr:unnamed protein product [Schistocephalus solidus]